MFRKMPFILLAVILLVMLINPLLPLSLKQFIYTISLTIKSLIILILPLIIFGLLFKAVVSLSSKASKIIGLILLLVCVSSLISLSISYVIGSWIYNFDLAVITPKISNDLLPLWSLNFPAIIANDKAMFAGIILGMLLGRFYPEKAKIFSEQLDKIVAKILNLIVYAIPFFVAGFIVKLQYDGVISAIMKDYSFIFMIIGFTQITYILLAYFILNNGSYKSFINNMKNMLPAAISGFSTMSSAASMPLTIMGAQNSAKNKDIIRSVIPATVNIHLVGDCFATPIFAFAILKSFGMLEPTIYSYFIFALYFILAKFSVAAIPGGGILVMLSILEANLGFNAGMLSLITALYIIFDPVITCANVLGNGAFAKMIDKITASNA